MTKEQPLRFKTISEYHRFRGLEKPQHPLISIVNFDQFKLLSENEPKSILFDFYSIALKRNSNIKYKYGQQNYDFDEGVMFFMAPNQVFRVEVNAFETIKLSGWMILIHPDFLWNTTLANTIKQYEFFDYSVNEALFLSEKEEEILNNIIQNIKNEYHSNIDKFSQDIIISQIETLLNYSERYYQRQFITRKKSSHQILDRLENLLANYFEKNDLKKEGVPTVKYVADALNVSPSYLSGLLKVLTGQSTQQHIHSKLIEKAKEKLSTTDLSISQIAYELGFEHPQSFSKLFKIKSGVSPLEFRQTFN